MTDRRVGRTDVVQTEHTSLQLAPRAREPTLQCDCCWTHQRISRCLPTAAETARLCRHREVLQCASVSPAVGTYHTISLPALSALTYCRVLFNQLTHFRPPCVIIICLTAATTDNRAYDKCTEPSNDQKTAWLARHSITYKIRLLRLWFQKKTNSNYRFWNKTTTTANGNACLFSQLSSFKVTHCSSDDLLPSACINQEKIIEINR